MSTHKNNSIQDRRVLFDLIYKNWPLVWLRVWIRIISTKKNRFIFGCRSILMAVLLLFSEQQLWYHSYDLIEEIELYGELIILCFV